MAAIAIASCGKKAAGTEGSADSTKTDTTAVAEKQVDNSTIDKDNFTFKKPEGFAIRSETSFSVTVDKEEESFTFIDVAGYSNSVDEEIKRTKEIYPDMKTTGKKKIGDIEWTCAEDKAVSPKDPNSLYYFASIPGSDKGCIMVKSCRIAEDDPALVTVFESFKIKEAKAE